MTDVYKDENIDEQIAAQQSQIEKEIASEQPLVSKKFALSILLEEYQKDDTLYRQKIEDLCKDFKFIRRTRGDGNCFFRAFAFAYFESLIGNKEKIQSLRAIANKCTSDLSNLGYHSFTIDDFKDVFLEVLDKLEGNITSEELEVNVFCDSGLSDYIVVFLRLMVSSYLQMNSEFYLSFIQGDYATMKDFCSHEVEPMYKESDHIHVIALTNVTEVPVSVIYLDRGDQQQATRHSFPEDSTPSISILYRPGHYDIIYKSWIIWGHNFYWDLFFFERYFKWIIIE